MKIFMKIFKKFFEKIFSSCSLTNYCGGGTLFLGAALAAPYFRSSYLVAPIELLPWWFWGGGKSDPGVPGGGVPQVVAA